MIRIKYAATTEREANEWLRQRIERIRMAVGPRIHLGDVTNKTVPKMCLIAYPQQGSMVSTRTPIPQRVHEAIGVLGVDCGW